MSSQKKWDTSKWMSFVAGTLPVTSFVNMVAPFALRSLVNKNLEKLQGLNGHVQKIDISVFNRTITLKEIFIDRLDDSNEQFMFFSAGEVIVKYDWKSLWQGKLECDIEIRKPVFSFSAAKERNVQRKPAPAKMNGLDVLINRLELIDGELEFVDEKVSPTLELRTTGIRVLAVNLSNQLRPADELPSEMVVKMDLYQGQFNCRAKLNVFAPSFAVEADLTNVDMVSLNDFFRAYGDFDVNKGELNLHTDVKSKGGKFEGCVQSSIKDLDILGPEDKSDNFLRKLWEGVLGAVTDMLEDHKTDELKTSTPFKGTFKNPAQHILYSIFETLMHSFMHGMNSCIEYDIKFKDSKKPQ